MAASDPFAAKRALFALFAANTGVGQVLEGVQVEYAYPATIGMKCVYGGGVRFEHQDLVEEGIGILVGETVSVGVYVRVVTRPGQSVEATDIIANSIGVALLGLVKASPVLAGAGNWVGVGRAANIQGGAGQAGIGDYERTDDETVCRLGYQFQFGHQISY
jgi:hypothetical protein